MVNAAFHVTLFALVAAASPLILTATLVVIRGERPRVDGIGFLAGNVLGTTLACVLGLIVGAAFVARVDSHATLEAIVGLLVGAALLVVGTRAWRSDDAQAGSGRGSAIMADLHEMGPAAACTMAAILGFGGPKRLVLNLLAMGAVSGADIGRVADGILVLVYIVIATALVWGPVGFVMLAPDRAIPMLERCRSWVTAHARELRIWISLPLGAMLVVDGLLRLNA